MTLLSTLITAAIFLSGSIVGGLVAFVYMTKQGYTETGLMKVGYCVLDDDDNVLGYAKVPEEYAAIMEGREYASAAPMYIKLED